MSDARIRPTLPAAITFALSVTAPAPTLAHAFGVRYDLPLPLWLYLAGAGAAVALSFAVMALFLRERGDGAESMRFDILMLPPLRWLGSAGFLNGVRALALVVFIFVLAAALFGNPNPFRNVAPVFVWVVWWVGMAFLSTLAGNLWDLLNPWSSAFAWLAGDRRVARSYPSRLGHWPAVALFLGFAWLELISEQGEHPRTLALLIVAYSAVTWAGMAYFGRTAWLRHGEVFTVVFSLLARFAPSHGAAGRWWLRPPAVGLLSRKPVHFSAVCFVLLLLTSVTFDGILETPLWAAVLEWIAESRTLRPALLALQNAGADLIVIIKTVALVVLPVIFIAVYLLTCRAIARAGGGAVGTGAVAGYFVFSLVPIAIAYHLAHYLSYLLIAGQGIIPLLSDPFGRGWDLFGTAGYAVDIGVVNAKMIWYVAVTAIVTGHVLAVYIAHVMAVRVFENRTLALRSQVPMLVLMVGYTMISLWILSQPIVAR